MQSVNVNQLQFQELNKVVANKANYKGLQLKESEHQFLMQKTAEFLREFSRIIITDRQYSKSDGYFLLDLSAKGIRLMKSKSVARFEYVYSFKKNEFRLNGNQIDASFLSQFMTFFDYINHHLKSGNFEIIEEL